MFEDLKQSEEYKKLSPKAQDLFLKIMFRCQITGENPSFVFDKLKAQLEESKRVHNESKKD
jgi:hypothetical protein